MRIFLIGVFLVFFSIVSIPLYLFAYILGKIDEKKEFAFSQKVVVIALRIMLMIAGTKLECHGTENVPKDEAVVFVGNHRSYVDILAGYVTVPNLTSFVSKDTLKKAPCISTWMRFLKCLFLDRENPKEGLKMILQGIEQMKQGYSIFIMPEGTRNKEKELLPFHEGSFKLSTKTGCAVVPVAMKNADKVIGQHFAWFRPVKVVVQYGEPVYPAQLSDEEKKHMGAYMREKLKVMLENME